MGSNARAFHNFEVKRDSGSKRRKSSCKFCFNVFILATCTVSLGICTKLYWDSSVQIQSLSFELKLLQETLKAESSVLHQLKGHVESLQSSGHEENRWSKPNPESFEVDESESSAEYNDPVYYQSSESQENRSSTMIGTANEDFRSTRGRRMSSKSNSNVHLLTKTNRKKRAALADASAKNGKRSLSESKMESVCENKFCDDSDVANFKNGQKQQVEDRILTTDEFSRQDEAVRTSTTRVYFAAQELENKTKGVFGKDIGDNLRSVKTKKDKKQRKSGSESYEFEDEPPNTEESLLAAHFGGHTSKYVRGRHAHYLGNGHMYHPGGTFKDWEPSPWVRDLSMDAHFLLKANGTLMVTKPGLYFVYAQIYYSNKHSLSSYRMYKNDEPILQCTVEMHNKPENTRNTCFAATLTYLDAFDQLSLKEVEGERVTIFERTKSFFGLFKINQS